MSAVGDDHIAAMTLEVISSDSDDEELELLAGQLRRELLDLDLRDIDRGSEGQAPSGAKGLDMAAVGTLVAHIASTPAAINAVFGVVLSWLGRHGGRSVKIAVAGDSIELSGVSSEDQHRLIEQWIGAHAG